VFAFWRLVDLNLLDEAYPRCYVSWCSKLKCIASHTLSLPSA